MKSTRDIDTLIIEHMNYLYRMAFRLTGCTYTSEDIVQDMFVNLSNKEIDRNSVKNPRAWLTTILYRTFIKYHRREKRSPVSKLKSVLVGDGDELIDDMVCSNPGPAEQAGCSELQTQLLDAIYSLSQEYRTVVVMHDVEGYTLVELEKITDTPLGTLKSRLHRARIKLQKIIQEEQTQNSSDAPVLKGANHEV